MERRFVLVLDALAPVLVGAAITLGGVLHGEGSRRPLALALALGAAASLFARRRAPGWTLVASGGLVLALFYIDPSARPIGLLAPGMALYSYVSLLRERLGLAERAREQDAERRVEQERLRIARELHDIVAHTLTTINVQAATAAELLDPQAGSARAALETIEDASRDAIGELRAILGVLRDRKSPDVPRAPAPGVEHVAELVARARESGLDVHLEVIGERPVRLSEAVSLAAYRIMQESLTNSRRHAPDAPVRAAITFKDSRVELVVENGAGMTRNGSGSTPGVGITGMTERAEAVGGTLHATRVPTGFRVQAELPCQLRGR